MHIIRIVTLGFLLAGCVVGAFIFLTYFNNKNIINANQVVAHTQQVLYNSEEVLNDAITIGSGFRNYLTTRDQHAMEQSDLAAKRIFTTIDSLIQLVADNPKQIAKLDSVKIFAQQRIAYTDSLLQFASQNNEAAAETLLAAGRGRYIAENIRRIINDIQREEKNLLAQRQSAAQQRQKAFYVTFMGLTVAIVSILALLYYAIVYNLRQRNKIEAEIRESRNLFDAIINNIRAVVYVKDNDGRYLMVNRHMANLYGKQPSQMVGLTNYDLTTQEIADQSKKIEDEIIALGKPIEIEQQIPVNGKLHTYISSKFPLFDNDGRVKGTGGLVTDISERKESETKLKEAFDYINDLYHHAPCGYHSLNGNGTFVDINETELKWLGYTRNEIIYKMRFRDVITTDSYQVFLDNFEKFKTEGKIRNLEFEMIRKDGTSFFVLLNSTAMYNNRGEFIQSRSTLHDITDLRKAQNETISLNRQLEMKVKQLEETNAELNTFTYSASHDLRAPLRAISSYATLINREYIDKIDPNFKRMLTNISDNARKMAQLIDDLLVYSRIGKTDIHFSDIDMTAFAQNIAEELRDAYGESFNAVFTFSEPRKVTCDKILMRQVLLNLMDNAIKYSSKISKPQIHFGSYHINNENVFFVKDNGAGFDMRYSDKLFGVFQRLHSNTEFEGTGVGLAIVHRIVQKHGGKVWAESKPNEGATFYFSLPDKTTRIHYELN